MGVKACPRCGLINRERALRCDCGYAFPALVAENGEQVCRLCGTKSPALVSVCRCGSVLREDAEGVRYRLQRLRTQGLVILIGSVAWFALGIALLALGKGPAVVLIPSPALLIVGARRLMVASRRLAALPPPPEPLPAARTIER